jgi:DNA-binding NtrC family response regulator
LLAKHFLDKYKLQYNQPDKDLHPDTLRWMKGYSWPGNVRELENVMHREFLLADGQNIKIGRDIIRQRDQRKNILDRRQNLFLGHSFNEAKKKMIDQFEKKYLTWLIKESDGNVTRAARRAGKERRTLGKLLKKHNIPKTAARTVDPTI